MANDAGLVTGTPADVLCNEGLDQAERMAIWLNEIGLSAKRYYTSQWSRAQQTASRLIPSVEWKVEHRLGETNAGEVADWPLPRFLEKFPNFYDDPKNNYPGGESHIELNARVLEWFQEQLEQPCSSLMLLAHSGPIACILQHVVGVGMNKFPAFIPVHASLSVVDMKYLNGKWHGKLLALSLGPQANLLDALFAIP